LPACHFSTYISLEGRSSIGVSRKKKHLATQKN